MQEGPVTGANRRFGERAMMATALDVRRNAAQPVAGQRERAAGGLRYGLWWRARLAW